MSHAPRSLLVVLCLLLGTAPAAAQVVDAALNPGDSFSGEIAGADDVDLVELDVISGATLVIGVAAGPKSTLVPRVELRDDEGALVAEATATKKKVTLKLAGEGVPTTGTHRIHVSGADGSTGSYTLKFTEKLPKSASTTTLAEDIGADQPFVLDFEGAIGMLATITLKSAKGSAARPGAPVLTDPEGDPVEIPEAAVSTNGAGTKQTVKSVALSGTGTFETGCLNEGEAGGLAGQVVVKRAKVKKRKLVELPLGETLVDTLTGTVWGTGAGLEGASVTFLSSDEPPQELGSTSTDADGHFIHQGLPRGDVIVHVDGAGVVNGPLGSAYGAVSVPHLIGAGAPSAVPGLILLPDLGDPAAANQTVAVAAGALAGPLSAQGTLHGLSGPAGTTVTLDGAPVDGPLDVGIAPVDETLLPGPPFADAIVAGGAHVSPEGSSFDATTAPPSIEGLLPAGLDLVLPNEQGFAPGTLLDIRRFGLDGEWSNVTELTGQQGEVSLDGLTIEAQGVVLGGGFYIATAPVDGSCVTTLTGRLVAQGTDDPLEDCGVATPVGQHGLTGEDGTFTLVGVPAYVLPPAPCAPNDMLVTLIAPAQLGGAVVQLVVRAGSVVTGGTTDLGDLPLPVSGQGSLSGRLTLSGAGLPGAEVDIAGPEEFTLETGDGGQFFATDLAPGSYTASHVFAGDELPTTVAFAIDAGALTSIALQKSVGAGDEDVTVHVIRDFDSLFMPSVPMAGVQVTLVGSDDASSTGLQGTTNLQGQVSFQDVDGPFTITAQVDYLAQQFDPPRLARQGVTLVGVSPPSGQVTLPVDLEGADPFLFQEQAFLQGTVVNLPGDVGSPGVFYDVELIDIASGGSYTAVPLNPDGTYYGNIPTAGQQYHAVLRRTGSFEQTPGGGPAITVQMTTAAALALNVGPVLPNEALVVNFDFNDAILFDQVLPLTLGNLPEGAGDLELLFEIFDGERQVDELDIGRVSIESGGQLVAPDEIRLPDPADPLLAGYVQRIQAEFEQGGGGGDGKGPPEISLGGSADQRWTSVPATLELAFPAEALTLSAPAHGSQVDLADLPDLDLAFDDQVTQANRALTVISLSGSELSDDLDLDLISWELVLQGGSVSALTLPPTALPMFGTQGVYEVELWSALFPEDVIDLDLLFGAGQFSTWIELHVDSQAIREGFLGTAFLVGEIEP